MEHQILGAALDIWANLASILGLAVSVVGFWLAIKGITSTKEAAKKAEAAAKAAQEKFLKQSTISNCYSSIAVVEEVIRLQRKGDWETALDRHGEICRILVELKADSNSLNPNQQIELQAAIEQFRTIEKRIERALSKEPSTLQPDRLNTIARDQIVKLYEIATTLKNS